MIAREANETVASMGTRESIRSVVGPPVVVVVVPSVGSTANGSMYRSYELLDPVYPDFPEVTASTNSFGLYGTSTM